MKKFTIGLKVIGVLLAASFILAGCPNAEETDDLAGYVGVLGQVSGVVYNSATAEPIEGVTVKLGSFSEDTDENGAYLFKNVKPGIYTVSFHKEGFQFITRNVKVDAKQYVNDDPFGELAKAQYALEAWLAGGNIGNNSTVTIKNTGDGYTVEPMKETVYSVAYPLYLTKIAPLTGAIKLKVMVITKPDHSELLNEAVDEAVAIAKDVEFYFSEETHTVGNKVADWEYSDIVANTLYGPVKTGDNGVLSFTGLPAGVELKLINSGFTQKIKDVDYHFSADKLFKYDYSKGVSGRFYRDGTSSSSHVSFRAGNSAAGAFTDAGTLYIFSDGTFAFVSDIDAGSPISPKKPTDAVVLKFSEAIDTKTFTASLLLADELADEKSTIVLAPTWTDDYKTVSLSPQVPPTNGLKPVFPYSPSVNSAIGTLQIKGDSVAGAKLYATSDGNGGIPVYTEQALTLLSVEVAPGDDDLPTRAVVTGKAIKLTFNKAIDSDNARFWVGTATYPGNPVQVTISGDKKSVFVWTDPFPFNDNESSGQSLFYRVISAVDPADCIPSNKADTSAGAQVGNDKFAKQGITRLVLTGTNIYADGYVNPEGYEANFSITGTITLTFDKDIPDDASIKVYLGKAKGDASKSNESSSRISLSATIDATDGNKLNIKPTVDLEYNTTYYLDVLIKDYNRGLTYFEANNAVNTVAYVNVSDKNIIFRTVKDATSSVSAREGTTSATSSVFTVSGDGVSGKNTNTPLVAGKTYYVQFASEDGGSLSYSPIDATNGIAANGDGLAASQLTFTISKLGTDILAIKVNLAAGTNAPPAGTNKWTNVSLATPIGGAIGGDATTPNGAINTSSKKFSITELTVTRN